MVRVIDPDHVPEAIALYARHAPWGRSPGTSLLPRIRTLTHVLHLGSSLYYDDNGRMAGFAAGFWYAAVRKHMDDLFDEAFQDASGDIPHPDTLHEKLLVLGGGAFYLSDLLVRPGYRHANEIAIKLIDAVMVLHRPEWIAMDISDTDGIPGYDGHRPVIRYNFNDGSVLAAIRSG